MTNVSEGDVVRATFDGQGAGRVVIEGKVYRDRSGHLAVGGWNVDGSKAYLVDIDFLEFNETTRWLKWIESLDLITADDFAKALAATGLKAPELEESDELDYDLNYYDDDPADDPEW